MMEIIGTQYTAKIVSRLLPCVHLYEDATDYSPRTIGTFSNAKFRSVADGEAVTPTVFSKNRLTTIAPMFVTDKFIITDTRMKSDPANVMRDASNELAYGFADKLDSDIAEKFTGFTGGTVGVTNTPLKWASIRNASLILSANKAHGKLFCVLHPYQWVHLMDTLIGNPHPRAVTPYNDLEGVYFESELMPNITFVVCPTVLINEDKNAFGAMFAREAIGLDIRQPFTIETQRNDKNNTIELDASAGYGVGVTRPEFGVTIISDASIPA